MKNRLIYFVLVLLFVSCGKENTLEPTYKDKNWFAVEDDVNNPLKHKIYQVYEETGVPIFYDDLLGTENRGIDANGNQIIFEKRLDINYSISSPSSTAIEKKFTLATDPAVIAAGVDFVKEYFLPSVPSKFFLYSIFLVDELYEQPYSYSDKIILPAHKGMNTFVIGNISKLQSMDANQKAEFNSSIITYLAVQALASTPSDKMTQFLKISYDPVKDWIYYGMPVQKPRYPGYKCLPPARWEEYGFFDRDSKKFSNAETEADMEKWQYTLPAKEVDIEAFIKATLNYTPAEFEGKYSAYPKLSEKYRIMREIVLELGFDVKD